MIHVTKAFLPPLDEYSLYLNQIWGSAQLTNRGELVKQLEAQLVNYLGTKHLLCVSSGTMALQTAIYALKLKGEIITTAFSYVASVNSIVWANCKPIFVDIDPNYLTIDESKIEAAITPKTSAILATHVFGMPCDVEKIEAIALKYNLKVIYDGAHSFGVKYKEKSILYWGDISTLSFNATKVFHTGEGGAVICKTRSVMNHAYTFHNNGYHTQNCFPEFGLNGKMSELHAAMGLAMFPYVEDIITYRQSCSALYDALLCNTNLYKPYQRANVISNYIYYPVIFPTEVQLLRTLTDLNSLNIFPRRYFYPSLNHMPNLERQSVPISDAISKKILCLPLADKLEHDDISLIMNIIKKHST